MMRLDQGLDRGECLFLRHGAGLTGRELRSLRRAEAYNWGELRRELAWLMRPAKRILAVNAGSAFSRRLLREVLRPEQILFVLDDPPPEPPAGTRPGRFVPLAGSLRRLPDGSLYDSIVVHSILAGLELAPDETLMDVLAPLAGLLAPGGRLLLAEKTLDGVAQRCGELLLAQTCAGLARLRGRVIQGPQRLEDLAALAAGMGLVVTRRALIGRDPGLNGNRVLAAALQAQSKRLIALCPANGRIEAARLIDEARGMILRAPRTALPLALIVAEKPRGRREGSEKELVSSENQGTQR